ncbi:hypothetical protein Tco_1268024, partial [Tanacetum coccineum]
HGRLNGGASTKLRYSDDYLVDQTNKLQGGFVGGNGYGSLDDIIVGKLWFCKEQDPTRIMDGELGESWCQTLGAKLQKWCHVSKMEFGTRNVMAPEFSGSGLPAFFFK